MSGIGNATSGDVVALGLCSMESVSRWAVRYRYGCLDVETMTRQSVTTAGRCAAQLVLDMTVAIIVSPRRCARLGARAALQRLPGCALTGRGHNKRPEVSRAVSATIQAGFMGSSCAMPRHLHCETAALSATCGTAGPFAPTRETNRVSAGIGPKSPVFPGNRGRRKWAD